MREIVLSEFLKLVNGEIIRIVDESEDRYDVVLQEEYTVRSTIPRKYADRTVTAVATSWVRSSEYYGYLADPMHIDTILEIYI